MIRCVFHPGGTDACLVVEVRSIAGNRSSTRYSVLQTWLSVLY
jgi:hypothetical protein